MSPTLTPSLAPPLVSTRTPIPTLTLYPLWTGDSCLQRPPASSTSLKSLLRSLNESSHVPSGSIQALPLANGDVIPHSSSPTFCTRGPFFFPFTPLSLFPSPAHPPQTAPPQTATLFVQLSNFSSWAQRDQRYFKPNCSILLCALHPKTTLPHSPNIPSSCLSLCCLSFFC